MNRSPKCCNLTGYIFCIAEPFLLHVYPFSILLCWFSFSCELFNFGQAVLEICFLTPVLAFPVAGPILPDLNQIFSCSTLQSCNTLRYHIPGVHSSFVTSSPAVFTFHSCRACIPFLQCPHSIQGLEVDTHPSILVGRQYQDMHHLRYHTS